MIMVFSLKGLVVHAGGLVNDFLVLSMSTPSELQGGRCWGTAGPAVPARSVSSPKGRTPNIRYFVAKLSIVAIYSLYERPP